MKSRLPAIEKDFLKDQKSFEQLPAKTREIEILKDEAEKTTGRKSLDLQEKIGKKSK